MIMTTSYTILAVLLTVLSVGVLASVHEEFPIKNSFVYTNSIDVVHHDTSEERENYVGSASSKLGGVKNDPLNQNESEEERERFVEKTSEEDYVESSMEEIVPIIDELILTQDDESTSTLSLPTRKLKWGVFTGNTTAEIKEFEEKVEENPDFIAYFVAWKKSENEFPDYLSPLVKDKNRTLVIFWEAGDYENPSTEQPEYSYASILSGNWDSYISSFAESARKYGAPIILIPFSEMNGNWSPWSGTLNGNTPERAVDAYQYVRRAFFDIPNVKFGWAPNVHSAPNTMENRFEVYYPGDQFVDLVGVDGFNFLDRWDSFNNIFGDALTRLSKYGKPVYLFSFASAEGAQKAHWMRDAFSSMQKYPALEGWIWFNQNKEHNWLLWSDSASFQVFENTITEYSNSNQQN
jgi:hypothetical protein